MIAFNRWRAVEYTTPWALGRNPDFPDYSSLAGGGGDCSNFVSQVLLAGGWSTLGVGDSVLNPFARWTEPRLVTERHGDSVTGLPNHNVTESADLT